MRHFFLLLLSFTLFAGDPPVGKPLPADVQKEVDARDAEVAKAQAVFDAAKAKATAAAAKKLEAVVKTRTKAGDLEGAMAGKAVLDKWNGEVAAKVGNLLGEKAKPEFFVGSWDIVGLTPLKINDDGTAIWGSVPGTWTKGETTIKFSWGNEIDIPTSKNCKVVDHGRNDIVYQMVKTSK